MSENAEATLFPVTVCGRELMFRAPNPIQVALLHRVERLLTALAPSLEKPLPEDPEYRAKATQAMEGIGRVLDVFGSLAPESEQEWLTTQMLTGKIDDEQILDMLGQLVPKDAQASAAPVKKARRVRQ